MKTMIKNILLILGLMVASTKLNAMQVVKWQEVLATPLSQLQALFERKPIATKYLAKLLQTKADACEDKQVEYLLTTFKFELEDVCDVTNQLEDKRKEKRKQATPLDNGRFDTVITTLQQGIKRLKAKGYRKALKRHAQKAGEDEKEIEDLLHAGLVFSQRTETAEDIATQTYKAFFAGEELCDDELDSVLEIATKNDELKKVLAVAENGKQFNVIIKMARLGFEPARDIAQKLYAEITADTKDATAVEMMFVLEWACESGDVKTAEGLAADLYNPAQVLIRDENLRNHLLEIYITNLTDLKKVQELLTIDVRLENFINQIFVTSVGHALHNVVAYLLEKYHNEIGYKFITAMHAYTQDLLSNKKIKHHQDMRKKLEATLAVFDNFANEFEMVDEGDEVEACDEIE